MKNKAARRQRAMCASGGLRRRLLPMLVASCFGSGALANPVGPQVVNGQVSFSSQDNILSVINSPGSIINWQSFSINPGEITRFIQQNPNSAVLNRIVGQDPSQILGALQSNGRVFLINPNGILFGQGAQIDVNGLVASTLNISNQDFLSGKMHFSAGDKAAGIRNQGSITTPSGGQVYLIAPNIENSGIIHSPKGDVMLAAGHSVQLVDSTNPDLRVVVSAAEHEAINLGQIVAEGGRTGIYGALIKQRGIINADSAVMGESGKIVFKASRNVELDAGSRTTANGATGGSIRIEADDTTLVKGSVEARGSGGKGGSVQTLGNNVGVMDGAVIDASGTAGGGSVLIGGDYQGKGAVPNAYVTYTDKNATIKADATGNGDGGKIIVWADHTTRSYAHISARGGEQGGDGGFVETSGKKFLDVGSAFPDVTAPKGKGGTWLLDPENIEIGSNPNGNMSSGPNFSPVTSGTSYLNAGVLSNFLSTNANAVVDTTGGGVGAGNITVNSAINPSMPNAGSLELRAHGDINVNASIAASGKPMSVTLRADQDANGSGSVNVNAVINTNGGTANLRGQTIRMLSGGSIQAGGSDITLEAEPVTGMITLDSGSAMVSTGTGTIRLRAPKMDLQGIVRNPNGSVELVHNHDLSSDVELGSTTDWVTGKLELSAAELNNIDAQTLRILAGGNLFITSAISKSMPGQNLSLIAGRDLIQGSGAQLHGFSALRLEGANVYMNEDNFVGVVAGRARGGDFQFRSTNLLTVAKVDGLTGIALTGTPDSGNIYLESSHDSGINQQGGAGIDTNEGTLVLQSAGPIRLVDSGNAIASLDAWASSGDIAVKSVQSMRVDGGVFADQGNVSLETAGDLHIASTVEGGYEGNYDVSLKAGGEIACASEYGCGVVYGRHLNAEARRGIFLNTGVQSVRAINTDTVDSSEIDIFNDMPLIINEVRQAGNSGDILIFSSTSYSEDPVRASVPPGLTVAGRIDAGAGNVFLGSDGAIVGNAGSLVKAQSLAAVAGRGISLTTQLASLGVLNMDDVGQSDITITNTGPLTIQYAHQAGEAGGGISIINTGALTIAAYDPGAYNDDSPTLPSSGDVSETMGPVIRTGAGAINLVAHSPLTINGEIQSDSGNIALEAGASGSGNDNLTINAKVATAGAVKLKAGDAIKVNVAVQAGGGVTQEANGNVKPAPTPTPTPTPQPSPESPQQKAINDTTNTIVNTTTNTTVALAANTSKQSESASGRREEEEREDQKTASGTKDEGARKNEPAKKMYCN